MSSDVVVYVRPRCGLCDPVVAFLESSGVEYRLVDVSLDAALECEYGSSVPVVEVDGAAVFEGGMDPGRLPSLIEEL